MNSAHVVRGDTTKSSRLSGLALLLAAGGLIVAAAGCEARHFVCSNPDNAVFTPTSWRCWDDGPLAYRFCAAPACPPQTDDPGTRLPVYGPVPDSPPMEMIPALPPQPHMPPQPKDLPPAQPDSSGGPAACYTHVADDDPKLNAAVNQARATVGDFIAALRSPRAGQAGFTVWMAFSDGKKTEHMWLSDVTFDGKVFSGVVGNEPQDVKNVRLGQRASIEPAKISDWLYIENQKMVGGYTLRVVRERLSPTQRTAFDASLPFVME